MSDPQKPRPDEDEPRRDPDPSQERTIDSSSDAKSTIVRDGVRIDPEGFRIFIDEESVEFTATEFRLLHYFARHPGRAFTRDMLLTRVLGEDAFVIDRNIDVHVGTIRKKLGAYRDLIETVRGVGYRFREE